MPMQRPTRDSGASSMEWAILTPTLIILIMGVVQFAMVYDARHVALAAAQSGARTARADRDPNGWQARAEQKAGDTVQQIGPGLLDNTRPRASDGDGGNSRYVEVSGEAKPIWPFMTFHITERAGGPVECFRPDIGGGTDCQK
jgi:hypothetical protein